MGTTKKSAGKGASSKARPSKAAATRGGARAPTVKAVSAKAAAAESAPATGLDAEAAYEAALGEAKALAAHEVRPCRSDSAVTVVNVQRGTAAVLERVGADRLTRHRFLHCPGDLYSVSCPKLCARGVARSWHHPSS